MLQDPGQKYYLERSLDQTYLILESLGEAGGNWSSPVGTQTLAAATGGAPTTWTQGAGEHNFGSFL